MSRSILRNAVSPYFDEFGQQVPGDIQIAYRDRQRWKLAVDLVPDTDYFPDPTG